MPRRLEHAGLGMLLAWTQRASPCSCSSAPLRGAARLSRRLGARGSDGRWQSRRATPCGAWG
eukprot:8032383-Pyramimonas_sp.AAC.1